MKIEIRTDIFGRSILFDITKISYSKFLNSSQLLCPTEYSKKVL